MQDKETTGLTKPRRYALGDIEITIFPGRPPDLSFARWFRGQRHA